MNNIVIGLTGPMGAGKSVVASILKSVSDFQRVTLSTYVKRVAEARKLVVTRDSLQQLGRELRQSEGPGVLAVRALSAMEGRGLSGVIIDGIRSVGEVDVFEQRCSRFYLIGIDAPVEIRYKRHVRRGYLLADSFEQFRIEDAKEMDNDYLGFSIRACLDRARVEPWGFVVNNDHDITWLNHQVKLVWAEISKLAAV